MTPELSSEQRKEIVISKLRFPPSKLDRLDETTREQIEYSALLFPDDFTGNRFLNWFLRRVPEIRHGERFNYSDGIKTSVVSMDELVRLVGGKREFFKPGNKILDVGSGAGLAVYQMAKSYEKKNIDIIGVDYAYGEGRPISTEFGSYVAGIWRQLPFAPNSFDGILCCESFPRHAQLNLGSEHNKNIVGEITRVAKPGAIWRATLFPDSYDNYNHENTEQERKILAKNTIDNGWEVFLHPRLMIARLKDKKVSIPDPSGTHIPIF